MTVSQWAWLALLSILWGGSFFFVAVAVHSVSTLTLVLCRVGLAALVLLPVVWWSGLSLPRTAVAWLPFAGMALFNNILPFSLISLGQTQIASGLASVLNATTPLWTVLIAHLLTRDEKLTAGRIAGVALGVAGVAILIGPAALEGRTATAFGMACVTAGAISYGIAGVWGRRLRATPPIMSATCQLICSSVALLPIVLLIDQPWLNPLPSTSVIAALVALALLSTALAYLVFFHILAISGPANVMLVTLLIPVSSIALGTIVLGEVLLYRHILGALVIATALIVFDGRLLRRLANRPTSLTP